jgi:hypothetical protein
MIIKTPSHKNLRCNIKDQKKAKAVYHIMKICFKKYELRVNINLINKEPDVGYDGWITLFKVHNTLKPYHPFYEFDLFLVNDFEPIVICHELTHITRYLNYGHTDPRCHDEISVEEEAARRLKISGFKK